MWWSMISEAEGVATDRVRLINLRESNYRARLARAVP